MEYAIKNIYIRQMEFAKVGDVINGHAHNFDHVTYVPRGILFFEQLEPTVWELDLVTPKEFKVLRSIEKSSKENYNWVLILAGSWHRITAKEDNSMGHCIYSHRNPQGEVVVEYDGWTKGYQ